MSQLSHAEARALQVIVDGLNETDHLEIEIVAGNRAKYADQLFYMDRTLGLAKDLRLIEYKIVSHYHPDQRRSTNTILVYRYGENPDDPDIIHRGPKDPSGNWQRYFEPGVAAEILRLGREGRARGKVDPGPGRSDLEPPTQTRLLAPPSARSGRDSEG